MSTMKINNLLLSLAFLLIYSYVLAADTSTDYDQEAAFCKDDVQCNAGFTFPLFKCISGTCQSSSSAPESQPRSILETKLPVGGSCTSIRDCEFGLVCVSGNPRGKCGIPKGVLGLSHLITNLVQEDYTPGSEGDIFPPTNPAPTQPTPLLTSRAIAIIYSAAHDTYGILTGEFKPRIIAETKRRSIDDSMNYFSQEPTILASQVVGTTLIAGFTAAKILYPESVARIDAVQKAAAGNVIPIYASFGELVGKSWISARENDGSNFPIFDGQFASGEFLRHQPDPNFRIVRQSAGTQLNLGRIWGSVKPFALRNVRSQAFLEKFPSHRTAEYRRNLREVKMKGECNNIRENGVPIEDIGIFWGYDGAPSIGVPPRLYLQVVLAVRELKLLSFKNQIRTLTAVGVAMADAGIASWYWKFKYDLWRPVVGIREDPFEADEEWNPRGVALTNIVPEGTPRSLRPPVCIGINPNFPAYPSGHASFGTAAFTTLATMLGKRPKDIKVTFTSDEFNGKAIEGTTGRRRRIFTQRFSLQEAIQQNKDARVFVGVHWAFDSEGGEKVGLQVANVVAKQFS